MSILDPRGAAPLGPQSVAIRKMEVHAAHSVDVKEGRLPNTNGTHYLQVVLMGEQVAFLLPVTQTFLRTLGRQCMAAGGVAQAQSTETE